MNRRDFGTALLATFGAGLTGSTVAADPLNDPKPILSKLGDAIGMDPRAQKLLGNVAREFTDKRDAGQLDPTASATLKLTLAVNAYLLTNYPDVYDLDRVMTAPVKLVGDTEVIEARTRKLGVELAFEVERMGGPPKSSEPSEFEVELWTIMAEEVALELRLEQARLAKEGKAVYPYIPITTDGLFICPTKFCPKMDFKTRYGIGSA